MSENTFVIKRNDTSPSLEVQLLDADKNPVNLTNATAVFNMGTRDGETLVDGEDVTIVTAASGIVRYDWQEGDTSQAGTHNGEVEVTFFGGKVETFPKSKSPNRNFIQVIIPEDI